MAMVGLQLIVAMVSLSTRAALLEGMSPPIFIVYRLALATIFVVPIAYFSKRRTSFSGSSLGLKNFSLIFLASFIGVTLNLNFYNQGLYMTSSSIATAMINVVPAITFVIASIVGFEKVDIRSLRSISKMIGTFLCVSGAISIALLKGPKLLNTEIFSTNSLLNLGGHNDWLIGCIFLFGSSFCWALLLILQVPITKSYPDFLSLSAWMCFLPTLQSAIIAFFIEQDSEKWRIHSFLEAACCFFSGIVGSGLTIFVQAWCVSQRGPLISSIFNPLCTVITTILASLFLHEEIYVWSLVGATAVIIGLYSVLWGKAKDLRTTKTQVGKKPLNETIDSVKVVIGPSGTEANADLKEPLVSHR